MQYKYLHCPCGQIKGIETEEYMLFKGVRYAKANRWEEPQEITHWINTYDATISGPRCYQKDSFYDISSSVDQFYYDEIVEKQIFNYSEDCLNLNIWTPKNIINAPVLVYFHGGSYNTGGGDAGPLRGTEYCKRGIIVVTANYRLNAFSSAYGDGITGNYGLQDQACVLRWLKNNISAFGGNPQQIIVMGESAGAMSVQNLIFSPLAKDLISGAIMLSGGGILPEAFAIRDPEIATNLWKDIKTVLGANSLHDLKSVSPETLFATWQEVFLSKQQYAYATTPVIDGKTIPQSPRNLTLDGNINAVPTIISFLSEDMWPLTLYRTALEWGLLMEQLGTAPVYGFYFDRAIPGTNYGAFHACDIRYAFGSFDLYCQPHEAVDYRISEDLINYFCNFIKTGDPNGNALPKWNPITQNDHRFMHFGTSPCEMIQVPEDHLACVQKQGKPFPGM